MITVRTWEPGEFRSLDDFQAEDAWEAFARIRYVQEMEPERTIAIRSDRSGTFALYTTTDTGKEYATSQAANRDAAGLARDEIA